MGAAFVPVSARETGNWRSSGKPGKHQKGAGDPLIPTNIYKGRTAFIFPLSGSSSPFLLRRGGEINVGKASCGREGKVHEGPCHSQFGLWEASAGILGAGRSCEISILHSRRHPIDGLCLVMEVGEEVIARRRWSDLAFTARWRDLVPIIANLGS